MHSSFLRRSAYAVNKGCSLQLLNGSLLLAAAMRTSLCSAVPAPVHSLAKLRVIGIPIPRQFGCPLAPVGYQPLHTAVHRSCRAPKHTFQMLANTDKPTPSSKGRTFACSPKPSWLKEAEKNGMEFVNSFTDPSKMPKFRVPEVTIAGRSNVGKSSALNALTGRRKKLARVSKTPGRTRLVNLFKLGNVCTITDLPGYGFAKVSEDMMDDWRKWITRYLLNREQLRLAVVLVDSQLDAQALDAQLLDFLQDKDIPAVVVATKVDRLNKSELDRNLLRLREKLGLSDDQPIPFSSKTGEGVKQLWQYLQEHASD
eukprot:6206210-Pleurochrysis_carterae.AAC.3